jgi:hypothetical protein
MFPLLLATIVTMNYGVLPLPMLVITVHSALARDLARSNNPPGIIYERKNR